METIKVIDLLNIIASGEKIPKKIKWGDHNLTWCVYEHRALDELGDPNLFECAGSSISRNLLTDEVEIIEDKPEEDRCINVCGSLFTKSEYDELAKSKEDKKIEKLECLNTDYFMEQKKYGPLTNEEIVLDIQTLKNYINEIIDKVNGE